MIIVSQEKDFNLNYDNVESTAILNPLEDNDGLFRICAITTSDNEYTLGKYETEKRAKGVLQEIIKVYKFYNGKTYYVEDERKLLGKYEYGVYEMPVEKVDDK